MAARRKLLIGVVTAVLAVTAAVFGLIRSAHPPKPDLPYPAGQSLQHVRGNCKSGNELLACDDQRGPRTFLDVTVDGDARAGLDALFVAMTRSGWRFNQLGLGATDFSTGGAYEDIAPVYCKSGDGCVGLFRFEAKGYVLAWWDAAARP